MQTENPIRKKTFAFAIREGLQQAMENDFSVILIGEGVPDPKSIFGTT
ncbi:MAG: alpha-ketoacid dehydrogenase subunit beta, partial [Zetaproteobacteria bacterium CG_4_8_14_3_um_filter_59_5]